MGLYDARFVKLQTKCLFFLKGLDFKKKLFILELHLKNFGSIKMRYFFKDSLIFKQLLE